jgi:hypothetical protein
MLKQTAGASPVCAQFENSLQEVKSVFASLRGDDSSEMRFRMPKTMLSILLVLAVLPGRGCFGSARDHLTQNRCTLMLHWGNNARQGPYELAPGLINTEVDAPDGRPPSYGDLESLQYHNHTRVAVDAGGRVWVAYSGALRNEGESGMITEIKSSVDRSRWTAPQVVIAPASAFDGSLKAGRRISYPRAFVSYRGQLYLVSAIDQVNGYSFCTNEQGEALIAVALYRDGSVGRAFRISKDAYHGLRGYPQYGYNSRIGPSLYALANTFGTWGGSAPKQPSSAWTGYGVGADGTTLVEPNTIHACDDPAVLFRLWRDEGKVGQFSLYQSTSTDSGHTWSAPTSTDLPNSPSETALVRVESGEIALVGNAHDQRAAEDARDPLFLAIFEDRSGTLRKVYAIRQGLTHPQFNDGVTCGPQSKPCGAGYPGIVASKGSLFVSYSLYKQQIWLAVVPWSHHRNR